MVLTDSKRLSVNAEAVEQDELEVALNVCITSFGMPSLLLQSNKGGSGP